MFKALFSILFMTASTIAGSQCIILADYQFQGNALDNSGNGYDGVATDVVYSADRFGNPNSAAKFNGSSSFIQGTTAGWPFGNSSRTIELWYRTNDVQSSSYYRVFHYGTNTSGSFCAVMPSIFTGSPAVTFSGGYNDVDAFTNWNYNEWNHVICTYDGTDASVYLNGQLVSTQTISWNTQDNNLWIMGAFDEGSGPSQFFNGEIDDVIIYTCSMDASQIAARYAASRTNPSSCLVAHYNLNGNPNDISGYASHGTVYGAVPTFDRFGTANGAYYFDGVDDYIEVADQNNLDLTSLMTFSAWVKSADPLQSDQVVFGKPRDPNGTGYMMVNDVNTTGMAFNDGVVNTGAIISGISPTPTWYHFAVTYDGTIIKLFINGQLYHWIYEVFSLQNSPEPLSIGRECAFLGRYFYGSIDDIKVWNCTLSDAQIDSIYLAEGVGANACLQSQYDFTGNTQDTGPDNNDASIINGAWTSDRFGNTNAAVQYNGSTDYLRAGDFNLGTSDFTMEAWVFPTSGNEGMVMTNRTNEPSGPGNWWTWSVLGTGEIMFSMGESGSGSYQVFQTTATVSMNEWSKISIVRTGIEYSFYINGALVGTYYDSFIRDLTTGNNIVDIGAWGTFGLAFFTGDIDDIKVYTCSLDANEIDSLYQAEAPSTPCGLNVAIDLYAPLCYGGNNGFIDMLATGGQSPYSYYWSTGETAEDINGLFAGDYYVIVTDALGCDTTVYTTLPDSPPLGLSVTANDATCGDSDGTASVSMTGGFSPFTYQWTSGDDGSSVDSLSSGIYMVTVTDTYGCVESATFGINNAGAPSLSANVTPASCHGIFDADIDLTVTGGSSPYTYSWSNASTAQDLNNVKAGAYMVQVTDANGCSSILTIDVTENSVDLSNIVSNSPSCGNNDGDITVNPSGGAAPYSYQWSFNAGSATTPSVSNLPAGTYFVVVTDINGCSEVAMVPLSNPSGPTVQINSVTPAGCDGTGGNINIEVTAGQPAFSFEWSNGATSEDLAGIGQGSYSVDVTDGNGCVTSVNIIVPGVVLPPITLCMSTVNDVNGKVLCLWQKPSVDYISHFNIYRENAIAGQYDYWFSRPYDSTSQWTDMTANPQIRGWRYKVTYVDTCGNESPFGTNHKTIHLITSPGISGGVNIAWDHYEGFNFPTFYIERYHISTGWVTIDSVPSTLHTYFDTTTLTGLLIYAVNIESPATCDPTRVGVNTSRSNIRNQPVSNPNGVNENSFGNISIFPNPAVDELNIFINGKIKPPYLLNIFNALGELVYTQKINQTQMKIDTRSMPSGVYSVSVSDDQSRVTRKVIITK